MRRQNRVTVNDLLDESGRFKLAAELPRRVHVELKRFSVDDNGRIKSFEFRNRFVKFRVSKRRKKRRITKAMEAELSRRINALVDSLDSRRRNGA